MFSLVIAANFFKTCSSLLIEQHWQEFWVALLHQFTYAISHVDNGQVYMFVCIVDKEQFFFLLILLYCSGVMYSMPSLFDADNSNQIFQAPCRIFAVEKKLSLGSRL